MDRTCVVLREDDEKSPRETYTCVVLREDDEKSPRET